MSRHNINQGKKQILGRIDWIRAQLEAAEHINCTTIARQFGCATKTAVRDITVLREHYKLPIRYDAGRHTYYL